ncbi:MAG: sigma-70 family RNA polymerase sigma factor [Planctomycetes bacterium]|nr:sigma-70 family RNA polymerase sigma factor [Planctomycetota bacterium]
METPFALGTAEALRRLAQRRDPEAWTVLVERHGGEIFAVARQILRDEGLAEDATQEALLLVRDHAGQFKPPEAEADTAARGWLLKLACNAALQMLRSRKRAQARDERAGAERGGREPADEAQRDAALAELARLPDEQRQPLMLHYFGGLEYAQVAAQLDVPIGTAKARAHRGLETLRRRLAVLGLFLTFEQLGGLFGGSSAEAAEAAASPSASQQQGWRELLESARKPLSAPPPETGGWTTMQKVSLTAIALLMALGALIVSNRSEGADPNVRTANPGPVAETRGEEPALPPVEKLTAADKGALARAGNAFAMDLFGQFRQQEGNLFFSPYSVSTALGMLHPGARGATAEQIGKVLHAPFGGERLAGAYAALLSEQNTIDGEAKPYVLRVANRIWAQQGLPLEPSYVALTRQYFGAPTDWLDFIQRPEEARAAVNAWIADRTERMIPEMLRPSEVDSGTRLLLVNAIYFKGDWADPFKEKHTEDREFERKAGDRVTVPMMWKHESLGFCENAKVKVLRLPYKGETVAAYFILPVARHGLGAVEAGLNLADFETWRKGLRKQKVNVLLPRLKLRARADLAPPLSVMGMPDAFKLGQADFTGIVADGKLFLNRALHEAVLEMDEVGTRAAAATVFEAKEEEISAEFHADQPYLLLLRDEKSGAILFMGRISDPS